MSEMSGDTVPQWKKELILRRRLGRGRAVSVALSQSGNHEDFHPSVRTMRLLETQVSANFNSVLSGVSVKMVEEKQLRGMARPDNFKNGKDGYSSDSSEELQYGPGIVNKLKSKYLSMTLRDNQKYSCRPSLSNMRRATSLENMLEDEVRSPKTHFIKKPYYPKSSKISQHHAKYLGLTKPDSMKRARSMDTLFKNERQASKNSPLSKMNGVAPSIINEDLIIVDTVDLVEGKFKGVEDKELPPPDVVKQTLKIFEPSNVTEKKKFVPGSPVKIPVKVAPKVKPQLGPKPILPEKRVRPKVAPKRVFPVVTPKETERPKPIPPKERPPALPVRPSPVAVELPDPPKYVSQKALQSIGLEGTSVTFAFSESPKKSYLPRRPPSLTQATNTALISDPPKPVGVIRPLTDLEIEKNLINQVKSVVGPEDSVCDKAELWEKNPWQSQNTMVFNFSARQSVPDYIENDGLNITPHRSSSKLNGDKDETDNEEDWEPSPSSVTFIGDNILINGKSNLRKEPKSNKVQFKKIQFNDEATTLFEYPSEESMREEPPTPPLLTPPSPTSPLGRTNFSTYTPSKSTGSETFELGVTRTVPTPPPSSQPADKQDDSYLKPADSAQETAWSQETASDILF